MFLCQRRLFNTKGKPMDLGRKTVAAQESVHLATVAEVTAWIEACMDQAAWFYVENLDVKGPWTVKK